MFIWICHSAVSPYLPWFTKLSINEDTCLSFYLRSIFIALRAIIWIRDQGMSTSMMTMPNVLSPWLKYGGWVSLEWVRTCYAPHMAVWSVITIWFNIIFIVIPQPSIIDLNQTPHKSMSLWWCLVDGSPVLIFQSRSLCSYKTIDNLVITTILRMYASIPQCHDITIKLKCKNRTKKHL